MKREVLNNIKNQNTKNHIKINLFLLVVSCLLGLFLTEILYRWYRISFNITSIRATSNQYLFYRFDPLLGWKNFPNASGIFEREEFSYPIKINQFGMREKNVSIKKTKPRVVFLGDSFTWGIGVRTEERFTELITKQLAGLEILNFGVSGYSPIQYYLMLNNVFKFKPDLVVIMFCLGNDFGDNVLFERYGYFKPYTVLVQNNELKIKGFPLPNIKRFRNYTPNVLFYSWFVGDIINKIFEFNIKQKGLVGFQDEFIYKELNDFQTVDREKKEVAIKINELLLGEIKRKINNLGGELMVVSVPTKLEFNTIRGSINYSAEKILEKSCKKNKINFVPLTSKFTINDFWKIDAHWRPAGHKIVADELSEFLQEKFVLNQEMKNINKRIAF